MLMVLCTLVKMMVVIFLLKFFIVNVHAGLPEVMDLAEGMLRYVITQLLETRADDIAFLTAQVRIYIFLVCEKGGGGEGFFLL